MGDRDAPSSLTQPSPVSVSEAAVFETPTLRRTKPVVQSAPLPAALSTQQPAAAVAVAAEEPVADRDADGATAAASRPAEMLQHATPAEAAVGGAAKPPPKVVSIKTVPTHIIPSVPFPDQDAEYETSESEDAEDYKKGKWTVLRMCASCCFGSRPPLDVAWVCEDCVLCAVVFSSSALFCRAVR